MAIITISMGSYSKGKKVAEQVAARAGYRCLTREVILDASEHCHIPEIKIDQSHTRCTFHPGAIWPR
jgi:hypothetical protein